LFSLGYGTSTQHRACGSGNTTELALAPITFAAQVGEIHFNSKLIHGRFPEYPHDLLVTFSVSVVFAVFAASAVFVVCGF
jgi:hypothetical protein